MNCWRMPFNKPNAAQECAITHAEGPARILAGPGSGKTFVIVQRLKYLIEQCGINPANILVITFTKAAAEEMKQRFREQTENRRAPVWFGTFHAVFYHILRTCQPCYTGNILTEQDKYRLINPILEQYEKRFQEPELLCAEEVLKLIGLCKNLGKGFWASGECVLLNQERFFWLLLEYEKAVNQEKKLDFDDMATFCLKLFAQRPDILREWQKKFLYIMVDEFQDINEAQYEAVKCLAGKQANLLVVGDDDQSIYGFRGANPLIMQQFIRDYPQCKTICLNMNYRSSSPIVEAAVKCIEENKSREKKQLKAFRKGTCPVRLAGFETREQEREYLIKELKTLQIQDTNVWKETAVIFRTNREAEELAEILRKAEIPFVMREKRKSKFEHFIMEDIRAYFRIALGSQNRKDFLRAVNRPVRYIKRELFKEERISFEELKHLLLGKEALYNAVEKLERDCGRLKSMPPYLGVNYIRKGIGYDDYLKEYAKSKRESFEKLTELADSLQTSAKDFRDFASWDAYATAFQSEYRCEDEKPKNGVHLMTMHGAKGLEYSCVFLPDLNEGVIPHGKVIAEGEKLEEERRMLYVGMTRARERLELLFVNGREEMSRFLIPIRDGGK